MKLSAPLGVCSCARAPALIEIIPNLFHNLLSLMQDISVFEIRSAKREASLIFKETCLRCPGVQTFQTTGEDKGGSDVDPEKRPSERVILGNNPLESPPTQAYRCLRVLILQTLAVKILLALREICYGFNKSSLR